MCLCVERAYRLTFVQMFPLAFIDVVCNWEGMNTFSLTKHQQYFAWCVHPTTRLLYILDIDIDIDVVHTRTRWKLRLVLSLLMLGSLSDSLLIVTHPSDMSFLLFVTELIKHGNVVSCEFMVRNIGFLGGPRNNTLTLIAYPDNTQIHIGTLRNRHVDEIIATLLRTTVIWGIFIKASVPYHGYTMCS